MLTEEELWCTSQYNQLPEVVGDAFSPSSIKIHDVTLRDGEQTIGVSFDKNEKLNIAKALDELGVDRIEAGMPVISKEDRDAVELILKAGLKAEIWGFCRAMRGDIDVCHDAGIRFVTCEAPTSEHKLRAYNFTKEAVLNKIVDTLLHAKDKGMYTAFFAVDATRTELSFLKEAYQKAVNEGRADEVVVVDTLGVATPETMFFLTKNVRQWVPVPIMTHCHNDFGMATACTLFSLKGGASCAQVTINGLGEKTGNADMAEIAIVSELYGIKTNIKLRRLYEVAKLVEKVSKIGISPLKPVVGSNVFKRESGVAVAQLVNYPPAVEGYSPELLGREREILLSKKSGKSSVEYKLNEMKLTATPEEKEKILMKVKDLGIQKKGLVSKEEFWNIVEEVRGHSTNNKPTKED